MEEEEDVEEEDVEEEEDVGEEEEGEKLVRPKLVSAMQCTLRIRRGRRRRCLRNCQRCKTT